MSRKQRTRKLWLNVRYKIKHNPKPETVVKRLIESIENGDYALPKSYKVTLEWRNKELAPMKAGPWQEEMLKSAASSPGWDSIVTQYLEGKR